MGSDDDTYVAGPGLAVPKPESASAAKTKSSDGSGRADGNGASRQSSRMHQEQAQNLKNKLHVRSWMPAQAPTATPSTQRKSQSCEMRATPFASREPEITVVASMSSGRPDPTSSISSGGGDGSGAPCPRSPTVEECVRNLKNNCRRCLDAGNCRETWTPIEDHPWFAIVVAHLRLDPCLDNSEVEVKEAPVALGKPRRLHMAVLMGDLDMVQKILETRSVLNEVHIDSHISMGISNYSALDLAIVVGDSEMVDALLEKGAKVNISSTGSLHLAVVSARAEQTEQSSKIIQSLVRKGIDLKAKDRHGYSAFYLAVAKGKTDIAIQLLLWKDKIHLNEECAGGRPPIQIANEEGLNDIESGLMQCEDVRRYIDSLNRDRQAYVEAANAMLVGAALIASVTFVSWSQLPLNYTTSYHGSSTKYVDVEGNIALGMFWVFNTLSFYFAIGAVVFAAHSVLPRRQLFIRENVKKICQNLLLTSVLFAFSVLFVIVAFGIAGFIVLIPILRCQWYMIAPTILGGLVCVGSTGYLLKSLWENTSWSTRNRTRNVNERLHRLYL